jgi:hypothetical protein
MAWPKGVPRKGYVKPTLVPKEDLLASRPPELTPELHGMTGTAITQPCPVCMYAYADGGYCPYCGWNKPIRIDEYGTHSGGRL